MIINLKELAFKGLTTQFHETIDITHLIQGQPEILKVNPLEVNLEAKYAANALNVTGELSTGLSLVCARCLNHFDERLLIPFHEIFTNLSVASEDDVNVHLITEDKVDLLPYVEENVILALPYVALCDESCLGLCPHCGINLNEQSCGCRQNLIDPRLEGLKNFLNEKTD